MGRLRLYYVGQICSIDGCGKPRKGRGWCNAHWRRWRRHGDPLSGGTAYGEPERYFREVVMTYNGDECLTWPFAKSCYGYGKMWIDGRNQSVSRLACEEAHGQPPTPDHQAAHSCGKGHLACVAKGHLSWKTPKENTADKIIHGTQRNGSSRSALQGQGGDEK